MEIKVKWEISYTHGYATFGLEEVNCENKQEWNNLTDSEKEERIQECIDDMLDSPSMILDRYRTV